MFYQRSWAKDLLRRASVSRALSLVAVAAAFMLTGCPPPKQPANTSTDSTGSPQAQARTDYRWPLPSDPMTLDPAHLTDTVSDAVARRLFNTLVRFGENGVINDDLAASHSVSDDGLVYTFTLPDGVKFHNGEACTAKDVVYSLRRVLDPATKSERAMLLNYVKGGKEFNTGKAPEVAGLAAPDDKTVKITLTAPYAPFIDVLCMTTMAVVPRSEVERDPQGFGDHPIGTGPYIFSEWKRDDSITLKANRSYFKPESKIQTIVFRVIKDEQTRFSNFASGSLEHCDIPPSKITDVRNDEKLKGLVQGEPAMDMYCYGFNCEKPPFKDNTALRQAFNYAVNKEHIVNDIWGGVVTEQKTYVPEGMFYFNKGGVGYPYDADKAAKLLEQAGYPKGKGLPPLVLNIDLQPTNKLVAEAVQSDLKAIGVDVRIETTDWGPFLEKIYAGEAQFHQNTWLTDYPDPDNWLFQLLDSKNKGDQGNTTRWSNSEFDHLVEQAQVATTEQERSELYGKAEAIAFNEAPWLLLFWRNSATLVQPYVKDLRISRLDRTPQLGNANIEEVELGTP
jgi:peptide/nickel transport system substrate-binding protein/oligopeptide transport system substrate-binding protein